MRCIEVRKRGSRKYPCTHPAVVRYDVDGEPHSYCASHDTQVRKSWAERYGIPKRVLA